MGKNANRHKQQPNGSSRGIGSVLDSGRSSSPNGSKGRGISPIRIGWNSNAPWAETGYGTQTAQVTKRLKKIGHEVAIFNNYGLEGSNSEWDGIPVYQRGADQYSNDVVPAHMHHWTQGNPDIPNILFTLYDVWVFKGPRWADWNVASWVPIDHIPTPPGVAKWCSQDFVTPIAMSQYGHAMLQNDGIESLYIPHAIEKVFKPGNFSIGREIMKIEEDRFVVGMNAANKGVYPNRKAFGENLLAFSIFAQMHDDVVLYLHTDYFGSFGGIKFADLVTATGIKKEQISVIDPYLYRSGINQTTLASLYTAMDVLLATSYGEGFGVPTIEAQACGTRVIVSDFAASKELVGDGWLVEGQPLWDAPQQSFFNVPNVPKIVEALEAAYQAGRNRSQKAIDFAKNYDADLVFERDWIPALEVLRNKALERGSKA